MPALGPERRLTAAQQNGSYSRVQQTCLQGVATAAFDPQRKSRVTDAGHYQRRAVPSNQSSSIID